MNHKHRYLVAGLLILFLGGCASLTGEPFAAQVVDADTGQPLAGVNVVAHWESHQGSLGGDALPCGAANVEEAVTNQDGRFQIPGWGPVRSSCDLLEEDPVLYLFKSGYSFLGLTNGIFGAEPPTISRSDWDGKIIKMKKYPHLDYSKQIPPSYAEDFDDLNTSLEFVVVFPTECNWKKIPNMLHALLAEERKFHAAGTPLGSVASNLIWADKSMQEQAPKCGSPKAFIEALEAGSDQSAK